jgi:hypothetical protein
MCCFRDSEGKVWEIINTARGIGLQKRQIVHAQTWRAESHEADPQLTLTVALLSRALHRPELAT